MLKYNYDLFVIGGGSGGIRAARWSAQLGAKVALCEEDRLGGTCVIRGCIPKKLMVYASSFPKEFELAKEYGWRLSTVQLDWEKMSAVREREIARLEALYGNILKNNKVDFISGRGGLKGFPYSGSSREALQSQIHFNCCGGLALQTSYRGFSSQFDFK